MIDKRGTGLSDRVPIDQLPTLEERMDDVGAVMKAVGSERAALVGLSEGAPMCTLFAATYPERTHSLVLYGGMPRTIEDEDYPWAPSREAMQEFIDGVKDIWGDAAGLLSFWAPSAADDPRFQDWWNRSQRFGASPAAGAAWLEMTMDVDVRPILPTVRVPTLVMNRAGDSLVDPKHSRYFADHIPGAKHVELPGDDHLWWVGDDAETLFDEIEEFITGTRPAREPDRALATVLFTDIVGSTDRAAELGDKRWRTLLERHDAAIRNELGGHRGEEVKSTGDGFLATFDGPARGIRCAQAIRDAVQPLGIQVRAGLHTGECEVMKGDVGGIAVHIGARVAAKAGPDEVLVSSTVKDLVAGSGIEFADRGEHALKGVPGEWRLFAVEP